MAKICASLGKSAEVAKYEKISEAVNLAIEKYMYNEKTGLFESFNDRCRGEYSVLTNALCLLCGAAQNVNKDNIIKEQENIINEFKFYLNRVINENEKEIVDINKIIGCCEANSNKPVICYREANNAKLKIKSSIADSKQLLNKYNFDYIPETNFNIIKLNKQ